MKDFIILFRGREGTSPVVRTLDRFASIDIVRHCNDTGWEPFDRHNCGPMTLPDLERCLELLFDRSRFDMEQLNGIYLRTARSPLKKIDPRNAVGFKMRFVSPDGMSVSSGAHSRQFRSMMIDVMRRNNVVVFIAVRQDVLRWGLSKYHGDGTGREGHLQFKLARGEVRRDQIPKIQVDCGKLDALITDYEADHAEKRALLTDMKTAGVQVYPLLYEDLLQDKMTFFLGFLHNIDLDLSEEDVDSVLRQGLFYEKVHSEDIADFVINHEEVLQRFGKRYLSWR